MWSKTPDHARISSGTSLPVGSARRRQRATRRDEGGAGSPSPSRSPGPASSGRPDPESDLAARKEQLAGRRRDLPPTPRGVPLPPGADRSRRDRLPRRSTFDRHPARAGSSALVPPSSPPRARPRHAPRPSPECEPPDAVQAPQETAVLSLRDEKPQPIVPVRTGLPARHAPPMSEEFCPEREGRTTRRGARREV